MFDEATLRAQLAEYGLSLCYPLLKERLRPSIPMELRAEEDDALPIGASKLGGCPDLPSDAEWPRHAGTGTLLTFIGQINFRQARDCDAEGLLPDRGLLSFFYDCSMDGMPWGYDPADRSGFSVSYYDGDLSLLERKAPPAGLEEDGCLFPAAGLDFRSDWDLPSPDAFSDLFISLPGKEREAYWDLLDDRAQPVSNKLLGYADQIQGSMELECELVSHGLYCGDPTGYQEGRKRGLDKHTDRWRLLLQVDSNEELDMMWGDCGRLYLWLPLEALREKRFEESWLILQCG